MAPNTRSSSTGTRTTITTMTAWPRKARRTSPGGELRELINDLNVDEAAELIALAWVGRGDYDASEWADAVTAARERANKRTAKYLLGMPLLADLLEEGLEAIGA